MRSRIVYCAPRRNLALLSIVYFFRMERCRWQIQPEIHARTRKEKKIRKKIPVLI